MGEASFEPLKQALKSPDPQVRIDAVQALERNRKCMDKVIPLLVLAAKDGDGGVRVSAVVGLGHLGPAARPALPVIIEAFGDKDNRVPLCAATALQAIDPDSLAEALRHPHAAVRAYACIQPGNLGQKGAAYIPRLLELLKDQDEDGEVHYHAARSLERFGDRAKEIVPVLIAALADENSHARDGACIALGRFGADAVAAVPVLVELHNRNFSRYAQDPLHAVQHYPPARKDNPFIDETLMKIAPHALPGILTDLSAADGDVRDRAVVTVAAIGPMAKDAVPALRRLAGDEDAGIRRHVLDALANVGPSAKEALPELLAALNAKDADMCCRAAWACRALGTEAGPAVPQLLKLLKDRNASVRCHAVFALAAVADDPQISVPALAEALADGENFHEVARQEAVNAIARHPDVAAGQVPRLIRALDAVDSSLRWSVIKLLGQIGPKAKEAVPALERIAAIRNFPILSNAAKDAIGRIEAASPQTRPADEPP
jgi:HEAT repeat protein